ncbi:MAG: homogentisate 1,2-dioxygenase, partial [Bdellovibrionota bacterium]
MKNQDGKPLYQSGFGNYFSTEAEPGVLPIGRNSPQKVGQNLFAEQINGTAFTAPRAENQKTWFYRRRPSVAHGAFKPFVTGSHWRGAPFDELPANPTQMRWNPLLVPTQPTDFIEGVRSMVGHEGCSVHLYACNRSMENRYFYHSDADLLIVPQDGGLRLLTECGVIKVVPGEISVIPRGIKFRVVLKETTARGYFAENYGAHFVIPGLGPIGANGLANPRDFETPVAAYETRTPPPGSHFELITKFDSRLWVAPIHHSPLDVVGWHGNYAPYKYDLARFNTINTVSFDHPDPSIFTVLTSPSLQVGTANLDFVIFPPRWMVAEDTFRPPYYHRNVMSEYMGLIHGVYDAKPEGFVPGGSSLHNCMSSHGPDKQTFDAASSAELKPVYQVK